MNEKTFKVLSIDGGGIKGAYAAALLKELEANLTKNGGGNLLGEYFDLICGTSTGALIALGLAAGKSCSDILKTYQDWGAQIFPDTRAPFRWGRTLRQLVFASRYNSTTLSEAVKALVGGLRFSQSKNYLLIPVTNMVNYSPRLFKTKHSKLHAVDDCSFIDIALASAAAPTYFPLVRAADIPAGLYADGGLVANNPTMLGILEAFRVFVGQTSQRKEYDTLSVLSIGNYGSPQGFRTRWLKKEVRLSRSILGWMLPQSQNIPLLGVLMDGQVELVERSIPILKEFTPAFEHYCRLSPKSVKTPATPANKMLSFGLADARPHKLEELVGFGKQDGQSASTDENVRAFFQFVKKPVTLFNS
jgi:uncharacterized protein